MSKTSLQHSHSENHAKKRSAKDKNYCYERHKVRILSNRKQQYQKNVETERAASRLRAKVNYAKNPDPKKDAARVASKVNYTRNPEPKKDAACIVSKVNYTRNPEAKKHAARVASKITMLKTQKLKLGTKKDIMQRTNKALAQKEETNIHCVSQNKEK